jgi:parallel beta-helix repeat protein
VVSVRNLAKTIVLLIAALFLLSLITVQPATSKTTPPIIISIKADGTLEGTNSIQRNGNVYAFVSDIRSTDEVEIVINASNVVLDGMGFTYQGWITINGNNVEVKNMKIIAPRVGEALFVQGSGCKISNNEVTSNFAGIGLFHANNTVVSGNRLLTTVGSGIYLVFSNDNSVKGNTLNAAFSPYPSDNLAGISLYRSDHNTVSGNNLYQIFIESSSDNTVERNNISQGIEINNDSKNNTVTANNLSGGNISMEGVLGIERNESNNIISSNTLVNGGIYLNDVSNNILKNNSVSMAGAGFGVSGDDLSSFINDIDYSNTINGKRIYYLTNKTDIVISPSNYPKIGFLVLANCHGVTVQSTNLHMQGILMAYTSNSVIKNNNISNVYGNGLTLEYSSNNTILENIFEADNVGISFSESSQNLVSGNSIMRNQDGILISTRYSSHNNIITLNNIAGNEVGIHFVESSNNLIYNNNFNGNSKQTYGPPVEVWGPLPIPGHSYSRNVWDNGSVGGNYWSDYKGNDLNRDGLGDAPYVIDENNRDDYPLFNTVSVPVIQIPFVPEGEAIPITPRVSDGEGLIPPTQEPFTSTLVLALTVAFIVFVGVGLLVYFKKRKRHIIKET